MNHYYLAAELLTYAKEESTGDEYEPYYGREVPTTQEYRRIVLRISASGKSSGSGTSNFEKGSATVDDDLYYAIHGCNYQYNYGLLTITDYYDFAVNKDYEGLAGTAINTMYMAQTLGVIIPYDVYIEVTY